MDVADGYVTFVRHSQDMLREKVNEEVYTERLFDVSSPPPPGRPSLPLSQRLVFRLPATKLLIWTQRLGA